MALYPAFRRASTHITPLALRAVGFGRTRGCSIDAAKIVESSTIGPLLRFCTDSTVAKKKKKRQRFQSDDVYDRNLIRVLNSEIKCVVDSDLFTIAVDVPTGFPFKVDDNTGRRTIVLTREFEGENIRIEVDMPSSKGDAFDGDDRHEIDTSIPIVVTVSKANGLCMRFSVKGLPNTFSVHSLALKKSGNSEDGPAYTGPNFLKLNKNLRNALDKYLETRGLTSNLANFLLEYMMCKDTEEYLRWLRTLRKLIEH